MRRTALLATLLLLLAGCQDTDDPADATPTSTPTASAEHPQHQPGMTHSPGMTHPGEHNSAYADLARSEYPGLSEDEIEQLRTGAGAGLALPAELNGYPGPKHVLELADELDLTPEQRNATQDLYDATNRAARDAGVRVLDAYAALEGAFRNGTIDAAALDGLARAHAEAMADLRVVHLAAHLDMVGLLTEHQTALYGELRGYVAADHAAHDH